MEQHEIVNPVRENIETQSKTIQCHNVTIVSFHDKIRVCKREELPEASDTVKECSDKQVIL